MAGWKTYTGATLFALPGLLQVATSLLHSINGVSLDVGAVSEGVTIIGAALAVAGLGHKADKAATQITETFAQAALLADAARKLAPIKPRR